MAVDVEGGVGVALDVAGAERRDVFVSYAHSDREFCLRLREALGRRGKHVFLDESDIPPAARWERDLQIAIESADSFVFVLSFFIGRFG